MNAELKAKWVADLRTTTEPQTVGVLHRLKSSHDLPAGYCCLGRLCVVAGIKEEVREEESTATFGGSKILFPPAEVAQYFSPDELACEAFVAPQVPIHLRESPDEKYITLNHLNDWHFTFSQIADIIEHFL